MDAQKRIEAYMGHLNFIIERDGWAVQGIGGNPVWSYTIGLTKFWEAELVMVGADFRAAQSVLNTLGAAVRNGKDVLAPHVLNAVMGHAFLTLREVDTSWMPTDLFNQAMNYFGYIPRTIQVVMADRQGRFPWDEGHDLKVDQKALWAPYPGGWPDREG